MTDFRQSLEPFNPSTAPTPLNSASLSSSRKEKILRRALSCSWKVLCLMAFVRQGECQLCTVHLLVLTAGLERLRFRGSPTGCFGIGVSGRDAGRAAGTQAEGGTGTGGAHNLSFQVFAKNRQFHLQNVKSQGEIAMDGDFRSRATRMSLAPPRPP